MQEDLLILKLLKIPVTAIKYLSRFIAMLTYLPNYLLILVLDAVIFSPALEATLAYYIVSWPLRVASLIAVGAIFAAEFYLIYQLLSISHFHWGLQLVLAFIAFQALLALMRHGYLTMVRKYSPTKLKSPKEHLQKFLHVATDALGLLLALVNTLLVINAHRTLGYAYDPQAEYKYLRYILYLIRTSIVDLIRFWYVKIFFRLFPWRYQQQITEVNKVAAEGTILELTVLLTILWALTVVDLMAIVVFGCYGLLHPRRALFRSKVAATHQKYKAVWWFVGNSGQELCQLCLLLLCVPFRWDYALRVIKLVCDGGNDYTFHYWPETMHIIKLSLIRVPSLLCLLLLLVSVYKYKKYWLQRSKMPTLHINQIFKSKLGQQEIKPICYPLQQHYLVFSITTKLFIELPYLLLLVPVCTLMKPWNIKWVACLLDKHYDVKTGLALSYLFKNVVDIVCIVPAAVVCLLYGMYLPKKLAELLKKSVINRNRAKSLIFSVDQPIPQFFESQESLIWTVLTRCASALRRDLLFLPIFLSVRFTFLWVMGCPDPISAVQLIEKLWCQVYIARVKRSAYYQQYLEYEKVDTAAGMIRTQRERLRFWKFAHKACRHRVVHRVLSCLMPRKMAQKAKANVQAETKNSAISNNYWYNYNFTLQLLKYFCFFVIELVITVLGVLVLTPLTMWRLPSFIVLFKIGGYRKRNFFPIVFKLYKQMALDILFVGVRLVAFVLFPRACWSFYRKTAWLYTKRGHAEFIQLERLKMSYIMGDILRDGFVLYALLLKIVFVKLLWVRKMSLNKDLAGKGIILRYYIKDFLLVPQATPNIRQLILMSQPNDKLQMPENGEANVLEQPNKTKLNDINATGLLINEIVTKYCKQSISDLPYLFLMVFLLFTLPWRVYYIRNALLKLRQDTSNRREFIKLARMIANDYQCLALYIVLVVTIVRARRAASLFYRNFKINFYISTLKYSHLKQLRHEIKEVAFFYYSLLVLVLAMMFGPYRAKQTLSAALALYRTRQQQIQRDRLNDQIYRNTVKEGKSLQLLTKLGRNQLLLVFEYLNARELTQMTRVSQYFYDSIKEREQLWGRKWESLYASKYPGFEIKLEGGLAYQAMCVEKYKQENLQAREDRFMALAKAEFNLSVFETHFDVKDVLRRYLPVNWFGKLFFTLRYNPAQGYGPESNWPRPEDNQQYLALLPIPRRDIMHMDQFNAYGHWLAEAPIQFFIIRLNRIFKVDSHRRKKQLLYCLLVVLVPSLLAAIVYNAWGRFWTFDMWVGYRVIAALWFGICCYIFQHRFRVELREYVSLDPFDLKQDIIDLWNQVKGRVYCGFLSVKNFVASNGNKYVVRPMKWTARKIGSACRWVWRKLTHATNVFVQKIAKPLYASIAQKLVAAWRLLRSLTIAFFRTIRCICAYFWRTLKSLYSFLFSLVKQISKLYSNLLQHSLRLALSFGLPGELVFTLLAITCMVSPSLYCYFAYSQRWFVIFSTLSTMVLMVTGYKHLNKIKERVLGGK